MIVAVFIGSTLSPVFDPPSDLFFATIGKSHGLQLLTQENGSQDLHFYIPGFPPRVRNTGEAPITGLLEARTGVCRTDLHVRLVFISFSQYPLEPSYQQNQDEPKE